MNSTLQRIATCLVLAILCILSFAGCQPDKIGDKPGDEMNKAMTDKQKAIITEHKKQADQ